MKITENQLRRAVKKIIREVAGDGSREERVKALRNASRRSQYQWQKEQGFLPTRARRPGPFTGQLTAWMDGQKVGFKELPPNVQRVVRLFDSLDPERKLTHLTASKKTDSWTISLFGERWGHRRTREQASGHSSVGGDYTLVDLPPEVDDEVKIRFGVWAEISPDGVIIIDAIAGPLDGKEDPIVLSKGKRAKADAVRDWAKWNLKSSGSGWQLEPFAKPPAKAYTSAGRMGGW